MSGKGLCNILQHFKFYVLIGFYWLLVGVVYKCVVYYLAYLWTMDESKQVQIKTVTQN